jgi:hypothetical protein
MHPYPRLMHPDVVIGAQVHHCMTRVRMCVCVCVCVCACASKRHRIRVLRYTGEIKKREEEGILEWREGGMVRGKWRARCGARE